MYSCVLFYVTLYLLPVQLHKRKLHKYVSLFTIVMECYVFFSVYINFHVDCYFLCFLVGNYYIYFLVVILKSYICFSILRLNIIIYYFSTKNYPPSPLKFLYGFFTQNIFQIYLHFYSIFQKDVHTLYLYPLVLYLERGILYSQFLFY